jgi:uncharacterized protein YkwD
MKKSRFFAQTVIALYLVVQACLVLTPPVAEARETYVNLARRLNAAPPKGVVYRPDLEAALLQLANRYRRGLGKAALAPNAQLRIAARAHAADLLIQGAMGHVASTGQNFDSRMRALRGGALFLPAMAENAVRVRAKGLGDRQRLQNAMQLWIKSPSHRRALIDRSYRSVGTAVVMRGDQLYAVQIFSGPEVKTNIGGRSITID